MRRVSTASRMATARGCTSVYCIRENDEPPGRWHDAHFSYTRREISRFQVIGVDPMSCARTTTHESQAAAATTSARLMIETGYACRNGGRDRWAVRHQRGVALGC